MASSSAFILTVSTGEGVPRFLFKYSIELLGLSCSSYNPTRALVKWSITPLFSKYLRNYSFFDSVVWFMEHVPGSSLVNRKIITYLFVTNIKNFIIIICKNKNHNLLKKWSKTVESEITYSKVNHFWSAKVIQVSQLTCINEKTRTQNDSSVYLALFFSLEKHCFYLALSPRGLFLSSFLRPVAERIWHFEQFYLRKCEGHCTWKPGSLHLRAHSQDRWSFRETESIWFAPNLITSWSTLELSWYFVWGLLHSFDDSQKP